jgi:hypothetical protein
MPSLVKFSFAANPIDYPSESVLDLGVDGIRAWFLEQRKGTVDTYRCSLSSPSLPLPYTPSPSPFLSLLPEIPMIPANLIFLHRMKLMVVGKENVGKTTLIQSLSKYVGWGKECRKRGQRRAEEGGGGPRRSEEDRGGQRRAQRRAEEGRGGQRRAKEGRGGQRRARREVRGEQKIEEGRSSKN